MSRRTPRRIVWIFLALDVLVVAAIVVWLLRPSEPAQPVGPSIFERAEQTARSDTSTLSARVIPADDLPPAGTRSLFDHLVAQNDALPYPFEKLVELIRAQAPPEQPPVTLMIPLGRSLLKAQADFEHPRVLVAADFQAPNTPANLGVIGRGQLFLGFVENAREIEVISYNEAAGRYEFQLVQDYAADGQRRIVYARRAVCTTCHQNGSPIFPQRPWNETNAQPQIAQCIVEARGADPYLGVPPQSALAMPERFDELTDIGSFAVATQRIWLDGCGEAGAECRRTMLRLALRYAYDPGRFDAAGAQVQALRDAQQVSWPARGIAVAESDLRNRDPLAARAGWRGLLDALLAPTPEPGAGARSNEDLAAFERLPKLPADLDPLTPRPPKRVLGAGDVDGIYGLAAQFSAADIELLVRRDGYDWAAVERRVDALPGDFFAPLPFSRVKTMQALLGDTTGFCCLDTRAMSPPLSAAIPPLALAPGSPLQPFAEYCFACHRGNPNAKLDFMSGDDEAQVAQRIRDKSEIRDALDWERYRGTDKAGKLMPPADSPQHARLQADLAQNPLLLERMREQVPGLFDF